MSMSEVFELNIVQHKYFLREAFIYQMTQTEEGIQYLKNAYRLETTNPDRKGLRDKMRSDQK